MNYSIVINYRVKAENRDEAIALKHLILSRKPVACFSNHAEYIGPERTEPQAVIDGLRRKLETEKALRRSITNQYRKSIDSGLSSLAREEPSASKDERIKILEKELEDTLDSLVKLHPMGRLMSIGILKTSTVAKEICELFDEECADCQLRLKRTCGFVCEACDKLYCEHCLKDHACQKAGHDRPD